MLRARSITYSALLATWLSRLSLGAERAKTCSVGAEGSACTARDSVLLQRSLVRVKAHALTTQESGMFCCFQGACNSCLALSQPGDWCGASRENCESCSAGSASWCEGQSHPTVSPTPSPGSSTEGGKNGDGGAGNNNGGQGHWDGTNMKMTHYWDCSGQGCDASTLQPWNLEKYVAPPGYGPQDPVEFGGALYGEKMWLTGAASDALSAIMGPDDGCCGEDPNDGGVGGCGKCLLVQNPDSLHPSWTAVVMKKNRCPPHSNGCGANQPHFDIAAPGFDNLQWSTANVCGIRPGTGFASQQQSETLGRWYSQCDNTADCDHLCDQLPAAFQKGCKLFASWGWSRGNPDNVNFRAVQCPREFVQHIGSQFAGSGPLSLAEAA